MNFPLWLLIPIEAGERLTAAKNILTMPDEWDIRVLTVNRPVSPAVRSGSTPAADRGGELRNGHVEQSPYSC